ncbi:MAG TPA: hypothetical protein PKW54_07705 [Ferruginibacter sp.]|nr:hypothetical protein [Ferruginibacter sp.]
MKPDHMLPPERILQARSEVELRDQQLFDELATYVNGLIQTDFEQLVRILYRMDVSEPKLKQLLKEHPEDDAGKLIASMMIERQVQKIQTRKMFNNEEPNTFNEERW